MKNNEEFRASVFAKAAAYEENRKKERRERTRRAFVAVLCALIAVPIIYLPISLIPGNTSTAASTVSFTTVASKVTVADINSPQSGELFYDEYMGSLLLGEAQNIAPHELFFTSREEVLAYNSSENMIWILDEFMGDDFFEDYVMLGYYIETTTEDIYIKDVNRAENGDAIFRIATDPKSSGNEGNFAMLIYIGVSKEWFEEGHGFTFVYEKRG